MTSLDNVALIHGFGVGVRASILKKLNLEFLNFYEKSYGFRAFKKLIKENKAKVFLWREFLDRDPKEFLNVNTYLNLYSVEKEKALTDQVHDNLKQFLSQNQPEVIVCHSMGCYLLLKHSEKFNIPKSVKKIFLVQGDFDKKYKLENLDLIQRIEADQLRIVNCYCPWDTTLFISPFINKFVTPAGLTQTNNPYFVDVLFPLYKHINVHVSSISDKDFVDFIRKY